MERLKELRITAGCSLMEAAKAIGVSYTTIWSMEKGYRTVDDDIARRLRDFYVTEITNRAKHAVNLVEGEAAP